MILLAKEDEDQLLVTGKQLAGEEGIGSEIAGRWSDLLERRAMGRKSR